MNWHDKQALNIACTQGLAFLMGEGDAGHELTITCIACGSEHASLDVYSPHG